MSETPLKPRQIDVLKLLADGKSAREAAEILGISRHTANSYIAKAFDITGTHNTNGLLGIAFRKGWIT
ncbi:hypothetical protein B5M44_25920 [Shinella sumterensis]|uniref:helix-turn-helix transcriptional regulator n=1 Tax=Shinella sumterensis TaxID=1967501 RepID=UPI00106E041B|nr:helix-turn-helix transcriptional regulator [Shinella sumterensis]MCD1264522.1 hypothetical protein [Shinella sumterensis]TFE92828.1 hypothetical protein B5M44_25920 [Shinella sumterensis]